MTPDRRKHRGPRPKDPELFGTGQIQTLQAAVEEMSWLLTRAYSSRATLKLVGDRYGLTARQRIAVMRCSCSDQGRNTMAAGRIDPGDLAGRPLGIDGYNLLITLESALSGGLLLIGRDGCTRDLASVHGNYRKVQETVPALNLIIDRIGADRPSRVDFFLDRPVSNSGRLKSLLAELLDTIGEPPWNIELVDSPDRRLCDYPGTVVSTDSAILVRCEHWLDLAGSIIRQNLPQSWVLDLRRTP